MGTKNATSTTVSTPPSYVNDAYQGLFHTAGQIGSQPYTPYTHGFEADQTTAFGHINSLYGSADPTFAAANSAYSAALNPTYNSVSQYMSPYIDSVVNSTIANMNEMNGQQQQQVIGNAISKGAYGGNRVGVAQAELARQQALANNQQIAQLRQDAFQQAMGAAQNQQQVDLSAGSGLAGLGNTQLNANLSAANAQLGAGTQQQQFNYAQYLNQQGYPYQQASWLASVLGGIGPSAGHATTSTVPQGNILSQLAGLGFSIAGLFKDGGVVPSGYAGGGGVTPSNDNSPFPRLNMVGMPYTMQGGGFEGYVPTVDPATGRDPFSFDVPDPTSDNPFDISDPTGLMRQGAQNMTDWFSRANGGEVPLRERWAGRDQSGNIEDRRDWQNDNDDIGNLIKTLNRRKYRPISTDIPDFDPLSPASVTDDPRYFADGGVVQHFANGGNSWAGPDSSWDPYSAIHNIQWGLKNLGIGNGPDYGIPGAPTGVATTYGSPHNFGGFNVRPPKPGPMDPYDNSLPMTRQGYDDWLSENGMSFAPPMPRPRPDVPANPSVVPITVHGGTPTAPAPRPRPFSFFHRSPRPRPTPIAPRPRSFTPAAPNAPMVNSNRLAGSNQGFGGVNAMMPSSMNNSRWLTGYADGGVIPHMADGGLPTGYADILGGVVKGPNGTIISAPRYSPGYSPSEYAGLYARPSQAPVARSVKTVPVRAARPAYASIPANAGVYGGPGSRPAGLPASNRLAMNNAAPGDARLAASEANPPALYGGIDTTPASNPAVIIGQNVATSDPWGRSRIRASGASTPGLVTGTPITAGPEDGGVVNSYAPVTADTPGARRAGPLSRMMGSGDYVVGGPLTRLFNWLGSSTAATPAAPRSFTPPAASVPNRSRPITYDMRLANPPAGTRYTAGGQDMAFMPTSVQTSSRWNTGYANGGVIPHLAGGGVPPEFIPADPALKIKRTSATPVPVPPGAPTFVDPVSLTVVGAASPAPAAAPAQIAPVADDGTSAGVVPDSTASAQPDALADAAVYADAPEVAPYVAPPDAGVVPSIYDDPNYNGSVPFNQGNQFVTLPNPQYSQNIGDVFNSLGQGNGLNLDPTTRQALLAAGLGMMASKSPFALQGIGEGGLKGIETWAGRTNQERENARARAEIAASARGTTLTAEQAGLTSSQSAATRYTFTQTAMGVMVTDAKNPQAKPMFVPWGNMLPDGTMAVPNGQIDAGQSPPLFSTQPVQVLDPNLMSPVTSKMVADEGSAAWSDARTEQQGAVASNQIFAEIKADIDRLPQDGGLLTQGTGFTDRLAFARGINTGLQALGLASAIPEDQVAAGEDLNKLTFRLGGELSKGIGSNAASIIMDSVSSVPNGMQSREGAERVIAGLQAMNQRKIDYFNFIDKWRRLNYGSIYGADEYFNAMNPPELYALSAYVPRAAMEKLAANPKLANDFNAKYGNGRDVARFVLRR